MKSKLYLPGAEHAANAWRDDVTEIARKFVNLAENPPPFNYYRLHNLIRDLLAMDVPYEQIVKGVSQKVKLPVARKSYLEILPLVNDHFSTIRPDFFNTVQPLQYPIGKSLHIPIRPPAIYGVGGQLYLPWFLFWRKNTLIGKRERLFVSIIKDVMDQDPQFDDVRFELLFFAANKQRGPRELRIVDADDVMPLSAVERTEMLSNLVSGFEMAQLELARRRANDHRNEAAQNTGKRPDPNQGNLFGF